MVKNPPANAGDIGDRGPISGSGRSPGGGRGDPPRYSCLENPPDRGAWQATVQGVAKRFGHNLVNKQQWKWKSLSWCLVTNKMEKMATVFGGFIHARQYARSELLMGQVAKQSENKGKWGRMWNTACELTFPALCPVLPVPKVLQKDDPASIASSCPLLWFPKWEGICNWCHHRSGWDFHRRERRMEKRKHKVLPFNIKNCFSFFFKKYVSES